MGNRVSNTNEKNLSLVANYLTDRIANRFPENRLRNAEFSSAEGRAHFIASMKTIKMIIKTESLVRLAKSSIGGWSRSSFTRRHIKLMLMQRVLLLSGLLINHNLTLTGGQS